jgi:hypothetical protein
MDSNFYQFQLGLLAVVCVVLLAFERYLKSKKSPPENFKDSLVEENLEVGPLQTNGAAVPMTTPRAGALNTLMRKYLLVYAIVMGQYTQLTKSSVVDPSQRRRLAPRPLRLLPISRAIRLPRTASCRTFCDGLH